MFVYHFFLSQFSDLFSQLDGLPLIILGVLETQVSKFADFYNYFTPCYEEQGLSEQELHS